MTLTATTHGDLGMPKDAPGADSVVFGQASTAEGSRLLAYDIPGQIGESPDHRGSTHSAGSPTGSV